MDTKTYTCWDLNVSTSIEVEAETAEEAAEEYVLFGDWSPSSKTYWITVKVVDVPRGAVLDADDVFDLGVEEVKVSVEPTEPKCASAGKHDWHQTSVVGNGGGVVCRQLCTHCGAARDINAWDYDPSDGEQGLRSIEYLGTAEDTGDEDALHALRMEYDWFDAIVERVARECIADRVEQGLDLDDVEALEGGLTALEDALEEVGVFSVPDDLATLFENELRWAARNAAA